MQLVFFDLETSGFGGDASVLQIAARFQNCRKDFKAYMKPTGPISPGATDKNRLTFENDQLYHEGSLVKTETQRTVLRNLYRYLMENVGRCVMVAHNCPFDRTHLLRMVRREGMIDAFAQVIVGFTDTLEMLRNKYPNRRDQKGQLTLKGLAAELGLSTAGIHDAAYDAMLLERIALYHFTKAELIANRMSFAQALLLQ